MTRAGTIVAAALLTVVGTATVVHAEPRAKNARAKATSTNTGQPGDATQAAPGTAAGSGAPAAPSEPVEPNNALPAGHEPKLTMRVEPRDAVRTGELIQIEISALAQLGDDVTIAEQPFAPFEVYKKQARVEAPHNGTQRFVFKLELLAIEAGDKPIGAIDLRVVTKDNFVGTVKTQPVPYKVRSRIANEPNAQPKLETKPRPVLEDNYIPIYVLGGLAAAALIAGLTLLAARYWKRRKVAAIPPPPPRPPWEIAVEQLANLRRRKQGMVDTGQGALFVDQLSDVVRAYLGARYAFEGLETTTDEMLMQLKNHGVSLGFTHEVAQFLGRCDLVKFAKVEPDLDEVDLLFSKAQDLVHFSEPERAAAATAPPQGASPAEPAAMGGDLINSAAHGGSVAGPPARGRSASGAQEPATRTSRPTASPQGTTPSSRSAAPGAAPPERASSERASKGNSKPGGKELP